MTDTDIEMATEQAYVDRVHGRMDELVAQLEQRLERVMGSQSASTHQNRSERDSFAAMYEDRLSTLRSVGDSAVFGKLVDDEGEQRYIGRIGLFTPEREQLLVDWRAPAAAPFYRATSAHRLGVALRRHLMLRRRQVVAIEDDVLDAALLEGGGTAFQGEGALLAAVTRQRTGRMGDIVATIQSEQDRIIRAQTRGVLIVQGGPGTGKTAVALHRAAYLLYTHREKLQSAGVLIVAPTRGFLRYIERVLPSLGETGVVLLTPGEMMPGVVATAHDRPATAELKGALRMRDVLARAVRNAQRLPPGDQRVIVEGAEVVIRRRDLSAARSAARSSPRPHNLARTVFVRTMLERLADQYEERLEAQGRTVFPEDRGERLEDLRRHRDVRVALNLAWMPYTPQSLLRMLFSKPHRLEAAGIADPRERDLLTRAPDAPWTIEDVPLLDEAAELLGEDDAIARAESRRRSAEQERTRVYAQEVLESLGDDGLVRAEDLASRVVEQEGRRPLADRAVEDRTWAYGHVVVDEAQDLSPMMWSMLMRRCPTRSFTVVGDIAQTSAPLGDAVSWADRLEPFVGDRFALAELTVNYRTPRRLMRLAHAVARAHGVPAAELSSVREGEHDPRLVRGADPVSACADEVAALRRWLPEGRLCVIAPVGLAGAVADALAERGPEPVGRGSRGVDSPIAVMTPRDAKGLEFDGVVVAEPDEILEAHEQGGGDLYVALTRATHALTVVHSRPLPGGFGD